MTGIPEDPTYIPDIESSDLDPKGKQELKGLFDVYADVFSKHPYDLGDAKVAPVDIITTTEDPVKAPLWHNRMPHSQREECKKAIEDMKKTGTVIESRTPWRSSIVLVKKKDGTLRPCLDFRKLNEVTIEDPFPIPVLEEALGKVAGYDWYTKLDMSKAYNQIRLTEEASYKCGFMTEDNVYQMKRMHFGLKNATAEFMRAMMLVIQGMEQLLHGIC